MPEPEVFEVFAQQILLKGIFRRIFVSSQLLSNIVHLLGLILAVLHICLGRRRFFEFLCRQFGKSLILHGLLEGIKRLKSFD